MRRLLIRLEFAVILIVLLAGLTSPLWS